MSESHAPNGGTGESAAAGSGNVWERAEDDAKFMMFQSALEEVESKAVKQQEELTQSRQKAAELEAALKSSQTKAEELQQALLDKSAAYDSLRLEYQGTTTKATSIEESSKMTQERMDRLQVEGDRLRDEISRLGKENNEYKAKLSQFEAQSQLDESSVLPLQYQVQRLQTEVDSIQSHSNWLSQELRSKSEELSNTKMTQAAEGARLRGQVDLAISEKESLEVEAKNLREAIADLQKKNADLARDVHEARQELADTKLSTEEELVASRRVADLQKQQLERLQERYDGMTQQLQALKGMAEEAERDNEMEWKAKERELKISSKRILAEQASEYQKKLSEMQKKIDQANLRCKKAEDGLLRIEEFPLRKDVRAAEVSKGIGQGSEDGEPLNLTNLYKRLAETEDALEAESARRTKVEIKFARLETEIEASASIFQQQRQECELVREHQEEYKKRAEIALNDAASARSEADMLQVEISRLKKKNDELTEESNELAKQVQQMLVSRSSGADNSEVPQTVAQMQRANVRLITEYKRLKTSAKELEEKLKADNKSQEIEQCKDQVKNLIAERKRQETIVSSIVQQRDLYRALVMKTDPTVLGDDEETSALTIVKRQSVRSNALQEENEKIHIELTEARAEIDSLKRDRDVAEERLQRYEALNAELASNVDRLTLEISSSKAAVARSEADASYHKERVGRLEETVQRHRQEMTQIISSKDNLMKLNGELEQAMSKANAFGSKYEAELLQAQSKLRLVEAEAESAKAAEKRINDEAIQLRGELSKQGAMIESIQRIESSLNLKNNTEIESYKEEIRELGEKLAFLESKNGENFQDQNGKLADLELKVQELESIRSKLVKESLEAKNESVDSLKKLEDATKKIALLEAQLKSARNRLGHSSDDQDAERENRSKSTFGHADLEASKKEIEKWKERAATYEKLAKDNENALEQNRDAVKEAKQRLDEELRTVREELEQSKSDVAKRKEMIKELTNDLSAHRAEREEAVNKVQQQVIALKAEVDKYRKGKIDSDRRSNEIHAELEILQSNFSEAQSNYERELALHATARSDLRRAREDCESEMRLRKSAQEETSRLKAELNAKQSSLDSEKLRLQEELKSLERSLMDSRAQNSLLHAQLEKITEQIEGIQSNGIEDESGGETKTGDKHERQETSGLGRTVAELRELVKFVRNEKDAVQAQLDAARRATDRERTRASITQRNLEHAKAQLNAAQEASNEKSADADALTLKLKSVEEQCRLLNDSNALLQQQVVDLQRKLAAVNEALEKSEKALEPAVKLREQLQSEKAALLAEKESLQKEITSWKDRVQSLVSRFNQIDPEEHKKLVKKVDALQKLTKDMESKKLEAENETKRIRNLASRASTQLSQNKQLVEDHKKTIAKLATEKEGLLKAQKESASKKDVEDLRSSISKLEKERQNEAKLLEHANGMNEKLRDKLRQFQKAIQTLQKEKNDLNDKLNQAESKLTNEKEAEVPSHDAPVENIVESNQPNVGVGKGIHFSAGETGSVAFKASEVAPVSSQSVKPKEHFAPPTLTEAQSPVVPSGGFKFGPSENPPHTSKVGMTSKKRPAESSQSDQPVNKKPFVAIAPRPVSQGNVQKEEGSRRDASLSPIPSTTIELPAEGQTSGETKEMSMKEKLLEKKRLLMNKLKKNTQNKNTLGASSEKEDPETKKAKVEPDIDAAKPSLKTTASTLDPQARDFVPKSQDPKSDEKVDDSGDRKEAGVTVAKNFPRREGKSDKPSNTTNPFGVTAGSSSIVEEGTDKPATFGSLFKSGTEAKFGQTSGFGSTSNPALGATPSSTSSIFGTTKKTENAPTNVFGGGSSLLNLKPPGSSSVVPTFSFGTSSNIKLPTPATSGPSQGDMFNAFSGPSSFRTPAGTSGSKSMSVTGSSTSLFAKEEGKETARNESARNKEDENKEDEKGGTKEQEDEK